MTESVQQYELMVIIDNSLDESQAKQFLTEKVVGTINELKGKISFEDFWGSRGFAYKINKKTWGYYAVLQFEMEKTATTELKKELNIQKSLVRFLLTKIDTKAPAPKKYEDMKKEWAAQEKEERIQEVSNESKKRPSPTKKSEQKPEPKPEEKPVDDTASKAPAKEEKKEDLDKKLDKIIEDSSLDL